MAKINLLPWRAELRAQQKKEFVLGLGFSALAGILLVVVMHTYMEGLIEHQNNRNRFIQDHIKQVDAKIVAIKEIDKQRAELKTRMELIQKLQRSRPEVVHLFDELPRLVPDGIYLVGLKRTGNQLEIRGRAESTARIAELLRKLNDSPWFGKDPNLQVFDKDLKSPVPSTEFVVTVAVGGHGQEAEEE